MQNELKPYLSKENRRNELEVYNRLRFRGSYSVYAV